MKSGKLNGKVSVVTGASKGIGAGIAMRYSRLKHIQLRRSKSFTASNVLAV